MTSFCDLNLKFQLILDILIFLSSLDLSWAWKSFITSGPDSMISSAKTLDDCVLTISRGG